jgi:mono/diheme cytochrome c family protein
MKKSALVFSLIISTVILLSSYSLFKKEQVKDSDKVLDILVELGYKKPLHYKPYSSLDKDKIQKGKELVTIGYTTDQNGNKTKIQSKHFLFTDCHNVKQEDPDLRYSNPDTRLHYAAKHDVKFLPATTLFGIVNRETWYNDDYQKKYGSLVTPAKDTLVNAIHLCAVQCSQGRELEKWEMDAVVEYFLSIGFNVSDLNLTEQEKEKIGNALKSNSKQTEAIDIIKSKYIDYSPATFLDPIPKDKRELGKNGNADNGKLIFELSCLTCHNEEGVTNYKLNKSTLTFQHLKFWANTNKHYSVYEITRKGTYAMPGYKPYMPNYTLERLSHQQLEDLMAYINIKNEN